LFKDTKHHQEQAWGP